jgi:DNA-binding transcriptional LysR family regulator
LTGRVRPWQLQDGRRAIELIPESTVVMNDGEALVAAGSAGMGLLQVPDYMAEQDVRAGRLVEVLARYRAPPMPISIVYPSARRVTPRLRVLIEALSTAFTVAAQPRARTAAHARKRQSRMRGA